VTRSNTCAALKALFVSLSFLPFPGCHSCSAYDFPDFVNLLELKSRKFNVGIGRVHKYVNVICLVRQMNVFFGCNKRLATGQ